MIELEIDMESVLDELDGVVLIDEMDKYPDVVFFRDEEVLDSEGVAINIGDIVCTDSGLKRIVMKTGTRYCTGMVGWNGNPWVMFDNGSWTYAANVTH